MNFCYPEYDCSLTDILLYKTEVKLIGPAELAAKNNSSVWLRGYIDLGRQSLERIGNALIKRPIVARTVIPAALLFDQ